MQIFCPLTVQEVFIFNNGCFDIIYRAILRKVVGEYARATTPKGDMGYNQCTLPGTAAGEPTFVAFL